MVVDRRSCGARRDRARGSRASASAREERLPLGQAAGALAFFTIAVVAHTRLDARRPELDGAGFHTTYGTYVGAVAARRALVSLPASHDCRGMTLAAALVALRLSYGWATRLAPRSSRGTDELVALPLVLTTLVVLDALRRGLDEPTWNTALLCGLAISLVALGLVERAGGFDRVHVPDLLHIDRV